jgi:hypothetical protein
MEESIMLWTINFGARFKNTCVLESKEDIDSVMKLVNEIGLDQFYMTAEVPIQIGEVSQVEELYLQHIRDMISNESVGSVWNRKAGREFLRNILSKEMLNISLLEQAHMDAERIAVFFRALKDCGISPCPGFQKTLEYMKS